MNTNDLLILIVIVLVANFIVNMYMVSQLLYVRFIYDLLDKFLRTLRDK